MTNSNQNILFTENRQYGRMYNAQCSNVPNGEILIYALLFWFIQITFVLIKQKIFDAKKRATKTRILMLFVFSLINKILLLNSRRIFLYRLFDRIGFGRNNLNRICKRKRKRAPKYVIIIETQFHSLRLRLWKPRPLKW